MSGLTSVLLDAVQDRGHVAGDEVFAVAEADDERAAVARGEDGVGFIGGHDAERVGAARALQRFADGFQRVLRAARQLHRDQMRNDLRVGLRLELVSLRLQLSAELLVVFDDAVVDDGDAARVVRVRVRVGF